MTSITWCGEEVRSPILRVVIMAIAVPLAAFMCALAAAIMLFAVALTILALPVALALHLVLILCRRRGFVTYDRDGGIQFNVDANGFRPRKPRC